MHNIQEKWSQSTFLGKLIKEYKPGQNVVWLVDSLPDIIWLLWVLGSEPCSYKRYSCEDGGDK